MIKTIVTDKIELALRSEKISGHDLINQDLSKNIIRDLIDTATYHQQKPIGCVGLAANQIGYLHQIVVIWEGKWTAMINPEIALIPGKITNQHEGCLSRPGVNAKIKRHKRIKATYLDVDGNQRKRKFTGFTARIIQHEADHLRGVFI